MPRLVDANGGRLEFEGVATVTIRICCMNLLIDFLVARELSVPLILGTAFIDEHVSAIFPDQHRCEGSSRPSPSQGCKECVHYRRGKNGL
jgi:hypothetical protein